MKTHYEIFEPTSEEAEAIDGNLLEEIRNVKPFALKEPFVPLNLCAKVNGAAKRVRFSNAICTKKTDYARFGEIDYGHCKEFFYFKRLTEAK